MFSEGSGFPPLLERWVRAFLGGPIPVEPRTTCGDCAMVRPEPFHDERRFERSTKCCTFFPQLASFAVGGVLLDDHPGMARGRERVRQRIVEGLYATPLGLGRPQVFTHIYTPDASFGHAEALRCPYYIDEDGGLCGVWRHREPTCATWFCKHERGQVGHYFWCRLNDLLKKTEARLSWLVALDLGIENDALEALDHAPFELVRDDDPGHFAAIWGPWAGRELEFYAEAARAVARLAWSDVRARCGPVLDHYVARAEEAHRRLREPPPVPERVQVAIYERLGSTGTRVRLRTYSEYNPLDVPVAVADAIPRLIGHPVDEAGLDEPTVRQLLDYGVLEE
jgi:hypothetical protein